MSELKEFQEWFNETKDFGFKITNNEIETFHKRNELTDKTLFEFEEVLHKLKNQYRIWSINISGTSPQIYWYKNNKETQMTQGYSIADCINKLKQK